MSEIQALTPEGTQHLMQKVKTEKEDVFRLSTMPTASAENVGRTVQFIGTTSGSYTHGYFYECKENSGSYSWQQTDVQPNQSITGKADKVNGATSGNFAALDSNGNLTDSGHKHSDYLTSHQDISGKADKVSNATNNNFAALDANGNLKDSGHKHSDYLTSHQDISGKADKVSNATSGDIATLDGNGNLTDSGMKTTDIHSIPSGGTTGQVLKKKSGTNYDVEWQNESGGGGSGSTYYGTSSTSSSTTEKAVTISGTFAYTKGQFISVLFTTANSANAPTLNVNGLGAKSIYNNNAVLSSSNALKWSANKLITFVYDGTYFRVVSVEPSLDGGSWWGTSSTSATTAAKTVTSANFRLIEGAEISVKFSNANTKTDAAITLNVNSTGAKTIYASGAVTSSTNHLTWEANDILTFKYDGTYWVYLQRGGGDNGKCDPSVDSLTLDDDHLTKTFSVDAYGTVMIKVSDTSVCDATISSAGVVTVTANANPGTATITLFSTGDETHGTAVAFVTVTSTVDGVYGVEWDGSALQSWTRTGDAANFTDPTPAVNNGTGSSPFDDILPWSGIVKENRTGGVMVKIPKFYYKWTQSGSRLKLEISSKAKTGFNVSPAHMNRGDGVGERDYVYVGRYHCASDYKSKTGTTPLANKTRAEFRSGIHGLGSTIWQYDIMTHITIWMLYLVEFANWDSQKKIGYGCSDAGSVQNMGLTDAMQYHTGTSAVNRTTYGHVQYRWIEDLWGNVYDWCDGIYFATEKIYAILNPANFSDTTGGTYVGDRSTQSSDYIKSMKVSAVQNFEWFLYPDNHQGASEDTYVGDYCGYSASGVVLGVGGGYSQGRYYGLFYVGGNNAASVKYAYVGSRLLELPAA